MSLGLLTLNGHSHLVAVYTVHMITILTNGAEHINSVIISWLPASAFKAHAFVQAGKIGLNEYAARSASVCGTDSAI